MLLLLSSLLESLIFVGRSKHCSNRPAIHAELRELENWTGCFGLYGPEGFNPIAAKLRDQRRADARLGRQ
jgi:hypothetical protein